MSKKQVSYDGVNWMDVDNIVDSTKYRHTRTVDDEASMTTVPCETCGTPTEMLGTKRCDACYEVEKRLSSYLRNTNGRELVRRLLQERAEKISVFDPSELEAAAKRVADLRLEFLFDGDASGASVMAEPHFLLALSLLEQATQNLKLASYYQAQANAGRNR